MEKHVGFPDTTVYPQGQLVSVAFLRELGAKVTKSMLEDTPRLIGRVRLVPTCSHECMAYRTRDVLELKEARYGALGSIAHLNNPVLVDWNIDGQIFEGWVLERIDNVLTQVIQVWWVKVLPEEGESRPAG